MAARPVRARRAEEAIGQYGTKVIPATMRDATYVLDAILPFWGDRPDSRRPK